MTDRMQTVQGRCPACRGASLFLGDGGHVTCSRLECPKPEAADELLHGDFVTESTNALLTSRMVASAAVYNGVLVRALNAEGAVAEVREYAATSCDDGIRTRETVLRIVGDWPGPEAGHRYLSTGCFHGDHDYCKSMTGLNGAKRPAECKKCGAKCICPCHREQPDA